MTQEDLDKKLLIMDRNMKRSQEDMARQAGADFPALVGNFFQGWAGKDDKQDDKQEALTEGAAEQKGAEEFELSAEDDVIKKDI